MPVEDHPLFEFRRARMRARYGDLEIYRDNPRLRAWLLAQIAERGPLRASDIDHEHNRRTGAWWGLSRVKRLLEYQFLFGELAAADRVGFERRYVLPEQVLPGHLIGAGVPEDEARVELVRRAAVALGVATLDDLADYFRLRPAETRPAVAELQAAGELLPVVVEGWNSRGGAPVSAWLHRDAAVPSRVRRDALLTPFDPVVWYRPRAERIHGFHYRIEIYIPARERRFGYYSLPVLLGDRLAARVDLKNDRRNGVLRVQSAWSETHAPRDAAPRVAELLKTAAAWQGLDAFAVQDWGDLASSLAAELATPLVQR